MGSGPVEPDRGSENEFWRSRDEVGISERRRVSIVSPGKNVTGRVKCKMGWGKSEQKRYL